MVRFALELALLAGAATAAWRLLPGGAGWLAAIAAVIVIAVLWGLFLSPKAIVDIRRAGRMILETVLFGAVAAALWATGLGGFGVTLAGVWILDRIALAALRR